jgi:hypothetical protein
MKRLPLNSNQSEIIRGPGRNDPLERLIATAVDDCSNPSRMFSLNQSHSSRVYDLEEIQKRTIPYNLDEESNKNISITKVPSNEDSEKCPEPEMTRSKNTNEIAKNSDLKKSMKDESMENYDGRMKDTKRKEPYNVPGLEDFPKSKKMRNAGFCISDVDSYHDAVSSENIIKTNDQVIRLGRKPSFMHRNVMQKHSSLFHQHKFKVHVKIENTYFKMTDNYQRNLLAIVKSSKFLKSINSLNNDSSHVKRGKTGTRIVENNYLSNNYSIEKVAALDMRDSCSSPPLQDSHGSISNKVTDESTHSPGELQDKILKLNKGNKCQSPSPTKHYSDSSYEDSPDDFVLSNTKILTVPVMNEVPSVIVGYEGNDDDKEHMHEIQSEKLENLSCKQEIKRNPGEFNQYQDVSVSDVDTLSIFGERKESNSTSQNAVVKIGIQQSSENCLDDDAVSCDSDCLAGTPSRYVSMEGKCQPSHTSNIGLTIVESPETKSPESGISIDESLPKPSNCSRRLLLIPSTAIVPDNQREHNHPVIKEQRLESTFSDKDPSIKFSKVETDIGQEVDEWKDSFQTNEDCFIELKDDDVIELCHSKHLGNTQFRKLIEKYATLSNHLSETEIAKMIVEDIKPGRFLVKKQDTWAIASFRTVMKRVKEALSNKGALYDSPRLNKSSQLNEVKHIKDIDYNHKGFSTGKMIKEVITPRYQDVLAGRHPKHPGNRVFESLILKYASKPISETSNYSEMIRNDIKPGRFLHLENDQWRVSSNLQISDKINHALSRAQRMLKISSALDKANESKELQAPSNSIIKEEHKLCDTSPLSAAEHENSIEEKELLSTDIIIGVKRYSQNFGAQAFQKAIDEHSSLLGNDVPMMTLVHQIDATLHPARFIYKDGNTLKIMPLEARYQSILEALEKQFESLSPMKVIKSHRQRQSVNSEARRASRQEHEKIRYEIDTIKKLLEEKDDSSLFTTYIEDIAWRKYTLDGLGNNFPSSIPPLPPPDDLPAIPTPLEEISCDWSLDVENRVLKASLKPGMTLSEKAKEYLYSYMERDDLALVMNGFCQNLDVSLWNTESMKFKSGEMYHHRFRRFKKSPMKAEEGSSDVPCCPDPSEYVEIDKDFSMKVSIFFEYLEKRQTRSKMTSGVTETTNHLPYMDKSGAVHNLDLDESIYMLDYDVKKKLPLHFQDFKDNFCFPEILPGGRMCAMYAVSV